MTLHRADKITTDHLKRVRVRLKVERDVLRHKLVNGATFDDAAEAMRSLHRTLHSRREKLLLRAQRRPGLPLMGTRRDA